MKKLRDLFLCLVTPVLVATNSGAGEQVSYHQYSYLGNTFNTLAATGSFPGTNPFSTGHSVTGYFRLDAPLAPDTDYNFDSAPPAGFAYSFSDGLHQTVVIAIDYFLVRTDSSAMISQWLLNLYTPGLPPGPAYGIVSTGNCATSLCGFNTVRDKGTEFKTAGVGGNAYGQVDSSPGTWTYTGIAASVPEPGIWVMLAVGLAMVGAVSRRRAMNGRMVRGSGQGG